MQRCRPGGAQRAAQGVAPGRASGAGVGVQAEAAYRRVVGGQQLFDGGQWVGAVLQPQFALPAPGLRCCALAKVQEGGAVFDEIAAQPVAAHGRVVLGKPLEAVGDPHIPVPQSILEPKPLQAGLDAGEGRALQVDDNAAGAVDHLLAVHPGAGAEHALLIAPQHALGAHALEAAAATAGLLPVRDGGVVTQLAGVEGECPRTVGDAVVHRDARAGARRIEDGAGQPQAQVVV
ncbi:hypothetical protein D3C79_757060 [compost metagenome]